MTKDKDIYLVSQMNYRSKVTDLLSVHRKRPQRQHGLNGYQKIIMLCKLFHLAAFAMALIYLAGDIKLNPGYQTLDDIKTTRGMKIAHLNTRSHRIKIDSSCLQGINTKTIDILTLSEY